jgi:hypothetical protein
MELSVQNVAKACEAINRYGGFEHPVADEKTLPFFKPEYVQECLERAGEVEQARKDGGPVITRVIDTAYHRNGISGTPFQVVVFDEEEEVGLGFGKVASRERRMVAIRFYQNEQYGGDGCTAVFKLDQLAAGDIAFGSNSWRGDSYEDALRKLGVPVK